MAFEMHTPERDEGAPLVADRRLYLAADEQTVVEEGDARSAFLLCAAGAEVPAPDVRRLGLAAVDGRIVQRPAAPDAPKAAPPAEDKEAAPPADNKAAKAPKRQKGFFERGG